ncbi:malignant T-cell-amplified sequence 1 [Exaiptasia diaphana]|uniref:PUA domain-containing protein n=1 Tax=Exaiptasia diaphana TaxID=2652724 RepID=A0A913XG13_EXADI|nr:malignant T-cell-amplified sequence 1 [Exaiptasia diaphana]KXJ12208.1 Malignant T-cell-amplified sequence 1-B [Exaiptasia diaphana]
MFKKFQHKENVSGVTQVKSSVQRGIKAKIVEQYPPIADYINQILPKKDPMVVVKCHEHIEILAVNQELLFFRQRDGSYYPTLRLLHQYPFMLPHEQVDRGAIRFILSGANIMCPGLTSPGAKMISQPKDAIVAIMAEGKEHALAIGVLKMSTNDIASVNKGIGVENIHYLNDGLWQMKQLEK